MNTFIGIKQHKQEKKKSQKSKIQHTHTYTVLITVFLTFLVHKDDHLDRKCSYQTVNKFRPIRHFIINYILRVIESSTHFYTC